MATPTPPGYYVQVGAFRDANRARELQHRLKRAGWPARIVDKRRRRQHLRAVIIGPWAHRKRARIAKRELARRKLAGFIIKHGGEPMRRARQKKSLSSSSS